MTLQERQLFLQLFYSSCLSITEQKGKDYNVETVMFLDALETAVDTDVSLPSVLWVHLRKHLTTIKAHFLLGHSLASEPVLGRLQDAVNYLALLAFYDQYKHELHAEWRAYWTEQPCEHGSESDESQNVPMAEHRSQCQRCQTLYWLEKQAFSLGSKAT